MSGDDLKWSASKTIVVDGALYDKQLEKALKHIEEAGALIAEDHERGDDESGCSHCCPSNTVIGVVGERGSGKTSFLYTLKKRMPSDRCLILNVVEPANFESEMRALELFLAQLFEEYNRIFHKRVDSGAPFEVPRIYGLFKEIAKILSSVRSGDSVYSRDYPSMEVLSHMADLVSIREKIRRLCVEFLEYINADEQSVKKRYIVMLIDDVDLIENYKVFQLLEDVHKFLSGNIVIVLTYREKQLGDSVLDRKLGENERLVNAQIATRSELQLQMEDFIEKVVPLDRTVRLKDQTSIIGERMLTVLGALHEDETVLTRILVDPYRKAGVDEDVTVGDWIDAVTYAKTLLRVRPVYSQEETSFAWPRNLRETISLVKMLQCDLDPVLDKAIDSVAIYKENLGRYQDYIFGRLSEAFDSSLFEAIARWRRANIEAKNYTAYSLFYEKLAESDDASKSISPVSQQEMLADLLDASSVRPENVTLGDVSAMLNTFIRANYNNESLVHLGYSFKVLYSMEILGHLLDSLQARIDGIEAPKSDERYLSLINSCVIAPDLDASPLSFAMIYPELGQPWEALGANEANINASMGEATIRKVMATLCCTPASVTAEDSSSRLGVYSLSRPAKGMRLKRGRYAQENRPIFTMREIDPQDGASLELSRSFSPDQLRRYPASILNILGKRWYLDYALGEAIEGETGAYLFYNMSDIDVIGSMRMEAKGRASEKIAHQMRRINTALVFNHLRNEGLLRNAQEDDYLMDIAISFERQLLARLHTPFVKSAQYRLYGPVSSSRMVSFSEIDSVYQLAYGLEELAATSGRGRARLVLREFVQMRGKEAIAQFSGDFALRLREGGEVEASLEVDAIARRLGKPHTRPSAGERVLLTKMIDRYPSMANDAFDKVLNEQH